MSVVAGVKRERPDDPSNTPSTGETSAEPLPLPEDATPLQREVIHARHERAGLLRFRVYQNDGAAESLIALMHCKSIYGKQLPKMPKEYIVRLVLDRSHKSLACEFQGQVVGGVTYRPHATGFAEIAFCAVSETHQVQGYGTRMMNQLKEQAKREGIQYFLTYADNHAIGYFRKQGFQKQVTMKRERWLGYIKDYDGGTLMECAIEERLDYLTTRAVVDGQRQAIVAKVNTLSNAHVQHDGLGGGGARARAAGLPHSVPGLAKTSWAPAAVECTVGGRPLPLAQCLGDALAAIVAHDDAWPFRQGVSTKQAPDYYEVVKDPIDLSMIQRCARRRATRRQFLREALARTALSTRSLPPAGGSAARRGRTTARWRCSSPTSAGCARTAASTTARARRTGTARCASRITRRTSSTRSPCARSRRRRRRRRRRVQSPPSYFRLG